MQPKLIVKSHSYIIRNVGKSLNKKNDSSPLLGQLVYLIVLMFWRRK